jgi:LRR receptor-like serine/threonine-protein kinase FLS2
MSNDSLERWLYSYNYCLNLLQIVNILVDVASALDYLHHCLSEYVVHCDLKPTNILLDEDMVAHVGDFGIAKILAENKDATQTKTLGTLGYIAPRYMNSPLLILLLRGYLIVANIKNNNSC